MSWTYEEIRSPNFLGEGLLNIPPSEIVDAFDLCEKLLGLDWIYASFAAGSGAYPTLQVVSAGKNLSCLGEVKGAQNLIEKIKGGELYAIAELKAVNLLRTPGDAVELEPLIRVGNRRCDFRIRRGAADWVYVEVSRPDTSDVRARLESMMESILSRIISIDKAFTLELYFRQEPDDDDLEGIFEAAQALCEEAPDEGVPLQRELPNELGRMFMNDRPPGLIVIEKREERNGPMLCTARTITGPWTKNRHVILRMPYIDQRAEQFLKTEAKQLPTDAPSLIMFDMTTISGGLDGWESAIRRRLQPTLHTRVGGVFLFSSAVQPTESGLAVKTATRKIPNPHAAIQLPEWLSGLELS
jgi:hypothetical protein